MILQASALIALSALRLVGGTLVHPRDTAGGYVQIPGPGKASFTMYSGCQQPACGIASTGFSAAINQLSFGSVPGLGPGDACGRCFALTGTSDPFSPAFTGPFGKSIVVKVTDMCPVAGNEEWCGQTVTSDANQFNMPTHFDICEDTGGAAEFFPSGHGALLGTWEEVSCSQWSGSDGGPLWTGACILGESAPNWPSVGCGNQGLAPGASGQPASTTSKSATTGPTTTATTTTPISTTSTASGPTQTEFGQCGGQDWTGPTVCASPFSCTPISPPFYSQCL